MKRNINIINTYITSGDIRSIKAKKNIIGNAISKSISILISLLLIPITINYVNSATYGIWLTLSSIIGWMSFFDIGISNGLRNKLAEAIAMEDFAKAKKLVSTTYAYFIIIFIPLMFVLILMNYNFEWVNALKLSLKMNKDLHSVMSIVICYFCLSFILSTINTVLLADQRPAESSFRTLIIQAVSLVIIFLLTLMTEGSLLKLALALCGVPLFIQIFYNIFLFKKRYRNISPSLGNIDFSLGKEILSLGFRFFIIQIAGIILFQSSNIIIIRFFGPQVVTSYNIAFKYFSILTMGMSIFISPLWTAVTDANAKNDFNWIKIVVNKYLKVGILFSCIGFIMLLFSNSIYHIWVGDIIKIDFSLSLFLYISNVISIFGGIYVSVLNGTGRLKFQFYASILSPILFLLIAYLLIIIFHLGVYSIVIAFILANFNAFILAPWEYYNKILTN